MPTSPPRHVSRSSARAALRVASAAGTALVVVIVVAGLRQSPSGSSAAFSASVIAGTAAWAAETVAGGAPGHKLKAIRASAAQGDADSEGEATLSGSGTTPSTLMHQERRAMSAVEELDLAACLGQEDLEVPMTQDQFLAQKPARLRLEHVRFSPLHSRVSVTLVTTYDIGRLHMLDGLCGTWGGHLSAAVYQGVTSMEDRENMVQWSKYRIDDAWKRTRQRKACALDIALWSELLAAEDPWMPMLFPVNSLRSRALLLARTELVLVLDGDMLVHAGLHRSLAGNPARYQKLMSDAQHRTYRVIAAFETPSLDMAYDVAEGAKAHTVDMFQQKRILRFNPNHTYPQGCTDYGRWQTAQEPYDITYCKRYEPWGIVSRRLMPWFDVRFRGYGRNKIAFAAALNSTGFKFVVDHRSFIIHRPHEATQGSVAFSSDAKLQGHVVGMYLEQARAGAFDPVVDDALIRCRSQLPWWT